MTDEGRRRRFHCALDHRSRGETLIELLVTVTILGIAVVSIVLAMGVALRASDYDRKNGRVETLLRNAAEAVGAAPYNVAGDYSGVLGPVPKTGGDSVVAALNGCLDTNASRVACDTGVQEITLTARSNDGRSSQTLVVVKRDTGFLRS